MSNDFRLCCTSAIAVLVFEAADIDTFPFVIFIFLNVTSLGSTELILSNIVLFIKLLLSIAVTTLVKSLL